MGTQKYVMSIVIIMLIACSAFAQDRFTPVRLTFDPAQEGFASWSPDGSYIVHSLFSWNDSLRRNGISKITLDPKKSEHILSGIAEHPVVSPDGRLIVFDADTGSSMRMADVKEMIPKKFLPDSVAIHNGGLPVWSPDGSHIVFKDNAPSLCVYDLKAGTVDYIFHEAGSVPLPACWSKDGAYVYFALMNRQTRKSALWKISLDGNEKKIIEGLREGFYRYAALSPDGSLLVYAVMEGKDVGLWVTNADGGKSLPLAITHPGHNESPAWSPDGKRLTFTSTRSGNFDIWMMDIDSEQLKWELKAIEK